MSFHLLTYTGSQTASTLAKLPAIADPAMTTTNSTYLLPVDYRAKFAFAMAATLSNARLTSPSIGANFSPQIRPIVVGAAVPNDPPICSFLESPLLLPQREGIEVDTSCTGPEQVFACIGCSSVDVPASRGEIKCIRGTATTTCVANTYTTLTVTWDSSLQRGIYDLVGADVVGANGVFYRFILTGQVERPGGLCSTALNNRPNLYFNQRMVLGSWGIFQETQLPQIEVMASGACTAQTIYMYLVKKS